MERAFLVLLAFFSIFPAGTRAQVNLTRACDLAAASPTDPGRPADIPGVSLEKIDPQVALPACRAALAASPENPRLLFEMGRASKDDNQARAFYEKAVAHGYATAQNNLAVLYENGRGGLTKSDEEAARLFKLAAAQGDATAQYNLGMLFESGRGGLSKDDHVAAHYFKLAADRDDPNAQFMLGAFYETGRGGLPKNDKEAARLYKLAADHGSMQARARLGGSYGAGGVSLPLDWVNAFRDHLRKYWNLPRSVDASSNLRVTLQIKLNPDGTLSQTPTVIEGTAAPAGGEFAQSAVKALELAQPFTMLKAENYNQWKELELVFDSRMFANAVGGETATGGGTADSGGTEGPH